MRYYDAISGEIKAAVTFMFRRVLKKDTKSRLGRQLMRDGGRDIRIAFASEDTKMVISRLDTEQGIEGSGECESFGWV